MRDRGRGGNIRNTTTVLPQSNYGLASIQPVRDIYRHKSSDDERESIKLGRRRRKKVKDKEMMTTEEKTADNKDKETQTEVPGFDNQVGIHLYRPS